MRLARHRFSGTLRAGLGLAASLLCLTVARAEQSPYYVGASVGFTHDSNLLRLGNDQTAQAGQSQSDTITQVSLLAGFDQPFGRQRAFANLSLRDTRYGHNTLYDNQGHTLSTGLDWSTIERISGNLTATANRSLASFNTIGIGQLTEKNLQDTLGLGASLNVGLVTEYSLVASLGHRQVTNSLDRPAIKALDFQQDNASVGVRWSPRLSTLFGVSLSETHGRYPRFALDTAGNEVADRYRQRGIDFTVQLQPSGVSIFDARISLSKTSYDLNQARDFSGLTGTAGWAWQPAGKVKFSSRYTRDTGQNSYAVQLFGVPGASEYTQLNDALRLQADYELSGKIAATGSLQWTHRKLTNSVSLFDSNQTGRDTSTVLSLGARWAPLRSVLAGCDISTEQRTAIGELGVPLRDNTIGCYGQFQLQQ
jgi:hypothetical protein